MPYYKMENFYGFINNLGLYIIHVLFKSTSHVSLMYKNIHFSIPNNKYFNSLQPKQIF